MQTVVLFRNDSSVDKDEISVCRKFFPTFQNRCAIPPNSRVLCRYSALPYYKELEEDLTYNESTLINSYQQHLYIANFDYYEDIKELTFPTWNSLAETDYEGPFVVKGRTNSRKHQWQTHMFAQNRRDAVQVASNLHNDGLIGSQPLLYRKYVPLRTFEVGINGLRFANEWRFFYYKDKLLSKGYYWSLLDDLSLPNLPTAGIDLAQECATILSRRVNFFCVDIAEKESGDWIVVEVNDGQMSGPSLCDLNELYANLKGEVLGDLSN